MIRLLAVGVVLTGLAALVGLWLTERSGAVGAAAGGALAVLVQLGALALMRDKGDAPPGQFMGHWALGTLLRLLGIVMIVGLVVLGGLPALPTALGFVGVILPLLGLELRLVD
ncbi:MAG: hypothetical protein AAB075_03820 [Gemmatimonadota bacterium]